MRQYIDNLTRHLIRKNGYRAIFSRLNNSKTFVEHIKTDLEANDVHDMSPAKLGEIMCSLETGDLAVSKKELFNNTHFTGDCEGFLRELVSFCLACIIKCKLDEEQVQINRINERYRSHVGRCLREFELSRGDD